MFRFYRLVIERAQKRVLHESYEKKNADGHARQMTSTWSVRNL